MEANISHALLDATAAGERGLHRALTGVGDNPDLKGLSDAAPLAHQAPVPEQIRLHV
jgi:hypothetical protein